MVFPPFGLQWHSHWVLSCRSKCEGEHREVHGSPGGSAAQVRRCWALQTPGASCLLYWSSVRQETGPVNLYSRVTKKSRKTPSASPRGRSRCCANVSSPGLPLDKANRLECLNASWRERRAVFTSRNEKSLSGILS